MAPVIVSLRRMRHGDHFRATSLRMPEGIQSPVIGVDHAWMSGPVFPPHHHAGLSAVSYVFLDSETGINNRDNIGTSNFIAPGGLHWTAAGRGIVHEEVPAEDNKTVHSLQIFVGLPGSKQEMSPEALPLATTAVPVVCTDEYQARILAGGFQGIYSPLSPPTKVTILDISLEKNAVLNLPLPPRHCAFILPIYGATRIGGLTFNHDDLNVPVYLAQDEPTTLVAEATEEKTKIMFFSGPPLSSY